MNYTTIRSTFNPGSEIHIKKPLFLMQTQFPIVNLFLWIYYIGQSFLKEKSQSNFTRDVKILKT